MKNNGVLMMVKHVCDLKIFHLIDAYLVDFLFRFKKSCYICAQVLTNRRKTLAFEHAQKGLFR